MLLIEEGDVVGPLLFREPPRHLEPVRALQREAASPLVEQATTKGVLPVGAVQDDLRDTASRVPRPPSGLLRRDPSDRRVEIRLVPGGAVVGLFDDPQQQPAIIGDDGGGCRPGSFPCFSAPYGTIFSAP